MLAWYRSLISLRKRTPALTDGRTDRVSVRTDAARSTLVCVRGAVTVAANLGASPSRLPLDERGVHLPPDSVAVLVSP